MTRSRVEERHVARMETIIQSAIELLTITVVVRGFAEIKWMVQAQAAVFTGSAGSAAPRATSGLLGFSAVATDPRPPRLSTDGTLASLVFPRILMSGFSAERPFAGPYSAPRARGDNLHDASSSPSSPCPPRSSTSTSLA